VVAERTLRVGAEELTIDAAEERPLLDVLRREAGVRSCHRGCDDGTCGACRVLVDGALVSACQLAWRDVPNGAKVETYESLAREPNAARAVNAFEAERPTRCKLCVGALGVTAAALARAGKARDDDAIDAALEGATCMCTGRGSWRRALSR
jgi:aerobic-type carbon monoxide dehydrogenase small subunit (CoxS/CutS family)